MEKEKVLKKYFGHREFRHGQSEIIDEIIQGSDVLGIMPTGAGKSMCYQVPALMMSGITIVISPLISLMSDQVNSLVQSGVAAAYINSSLTLSQQHMVINNIIKGEYKIIYVAPERLELDSFINMAEKVEISMITVDEAHCVSQWGHDFRPGYLKIADFIDKLSYRPTIAAFTATATDDVRRDIVRILKLNNPFVKITGFNRENLYFDVQQPKDKFSALCDILDNHKNQSAIVYCSTRKIVEEVCDLLNANNYSATRYHAGLDDEERQKNQDDFIYDRSMIMVATNAFGMGIDKSNVYLVVHYNMPKNIESYYQEAGRAGRDGGAADCVLLYSGKDVNTVRYFIENPDDNSEMTEEMRVKTMEKDFERLKMMTFYSTTKECLRAFILEYFGENPPNHCGNCGNCNSNFEDTDITLDAQKVVSCVYRIKQRGRTCGRALLAEILYGSKVDKIRNLQLDTISTYGIMNDMSIKRIRSVIDFLVQENYLAIDEMNYRVVKPTIRTKEILAGKQLCMKMVKEVSVVYRKEQKSMEGVDRGLFERLKKVRNKRANLVGVPAYVIFQDSTLRDMCRKLPITEVELLDISGVGEVKKRKYGKEFIDEIKSYLQEKNE